MKMFKIVSAALISFGVLFMAFSYWKEKTKPVESINQIMTLDRMEKEGAPDFAASTITSDKIHLNQFKGKVVIVNMWATWCGPCIEEVPSLISLVEASGGDIQLIAVSEDSSKDDIESFLKSFPKIKNPNIHVVWDEKRECLNLYTAERLPESYILNSELKLAKKIVGSINWHTPESVEYLKGLLKK